ncbi:MAG TPA: hypothetical protein VHS99_25505 [Chloroflexota bacterium]|nr:hypothetical protein [Chloroflexota bacterium]
MTTRATSRITVLRRAALLRGAGGATALLFAPALTRLAGAQATEPSQAPPPPPTGAEALPDSAVALRGELHFLFQEHTYLAGNTTDALLNARQAELGAAGAALNLNASVLGRLFGTLFGPIPEARFQEAWSRHINDYKRYTQGHLEGSEALRQAARADLESFAQTTEGLVRETLPALPAGSLANALMMHVHGTLDVVDAQAAHDYPRVYTLAREGAAMSATGLGDPLAEAIAQVFPQRFPPAEDGVEAQSLLEHRLLFQHHVFLASTRMAALLEGRGEQAAGVGTALAANSQQLADRVQAHLGGTTGQQFLALWRAHLEAFESYATAAARADAAARRQPADALGRLAQDLDALLTSGAGGAAVRGQIAQQLGAHVSYTLEAIDALAGHDVGMAYGLTGGAARQVDEIAARVARALSPTT